VLLNLKPGYLPLGLLVFLIRPSQVGGRLRYWLVIAATCLATVATALLLSRIGPNGFNERLFSSTLGSGDMSVDPGAQLHYIIVHPWGFAKVVIRTLADGSFSLASNMIGSLGWGNLAVWQPVVFAYWVGLAVLIGASSPIEIGRGRRALLALTALVVTVSVLVGIYVYANGVATAAIGGLQGRYFTPAMAPLLLAFTGISLKSLPRVASVFAAVSAVVLLMALAILARFYY